MIRVTCERKYNTWLRETRDLRFRNFVELKQWIFGKMRVPCDTPGHMTFSPLKVSFVPDYASAEYTVHEIRSEEKIHFLDGSDPERKRICSGTMCMFLEACLAKMEGRKKSCTKNCLRKITAI